ncbi:MAG: hypothetical protein VCD00_14915 [Candidatus Hydrogenedentota bacterium]
MVTRNVNTTPPPPPAPPEVVVPLPGAAGVGSPFSAGTGYAIIALVAAVTIGGYALARSGVIDTPDALSGVFGDEYTFDADGPFAYRFTEGEDLTYQLDASVKGKGVDLGVDSAIGLTMNMTFGLETQEVDRRGFGTLELEFDRVQMTGNFMGEDVHLYQTGKNVDMSMNKFEQVDTDAGDSIKGISQLEFFTEAVTMVVSPDGMVQEVSGPSGFDTILSPADALAPSPFQTANLEIGQIWTSEFTMPVPGLAVPASATSYNTLVRYEWIGTREVGVIQQQIRSTQVDGEIVSPSSMLGEGMNLTMPTFEVTGENWIYFDINDGKLVRTDMNLFFALELGEGGDAISSMLGQYSDAISGLDNRGPRKNDDEEAPLLEMGVEIAATLYLVE